MSVLILLKLVLIVERSDTDGDTLRVPVRISCHCRFICGHTIHSFVFNVHGTVHR